MTESEKTLVKEMVDFSANVLEAIYYIQENYGIECEFDPDKCEVNIFANSVNESSNETAMLAENHFKEKFGDHKLHINIYRN